MKEVNEFFDRFSQKSQKVTQTAFLMEVVTPPPNITLKHGNIIIRTEQIQVANYLLENYHRKFKVIGSTTTRSQSVSYTFTNGTTTEEADGHKHSIATLKGTGDIETDIGTFEELGDIWLTDTLQVGTIVKVDIVSSVYCVMAQMVQMPNKAEEGA